MTTAQLFVRVILALYPRDFRERFGDDVRATFADEYRRIGAGLPRAWFLMCASVDFTRSASAEWRDAFRTLRSPRAMLSEIPSTIRYAVRALRRAPGFATASALTLAVGIGATTAVFSVMSTALLTPLPYPNADRLVAIATSFKGEEISISYPDLQDFQSRARLFDGIAGFSGQPFALTSGSEPVRVTGQTVSANLFSVLGVQPILGHHFAPSDDDANAPRVAAISHALWRDHFGADSTIIGRAIILDGEPFTVTAVMPEGFHFPDGITYGAANVWTTMALIDAGDRNNRGNHPGIVAVGLLKKNVSFNDGAKELHALSAQMLAEHPATNKDQGVIVRNAIDAIMGNVTSSIKLLFGAAALVLLVACANVGGLFLTRAEARRREVAIKSALGADGFRVTANLIAEAGVVAVVGGIVGTLIAAGLVRAFAGTLANLPRLESVTLDMRALAFSAVVSIGVAIVCALLPVRWARRLDVQGWLQARGSTGTMASRLRHGLVIGQIAMSLVLLVCSALLLRTFQRASADDGGINADGVATFAVQLSSARYTDAAVRTQFVNAVNARLAEVPGVRQSASISLLPFTGGGSQSGIMPSGATHEEERRTDVAAVTPDYFAAMGITVVAGRGFTRADDAMSPKVVVVDERFAKTMWPSESAIGKHVSGYGYHDWEIVGIVRHVKNYGVMAESRQELYAPFAQRPSYRVYFTVRSTGDATPVFAAARAAIRELDPSLPVYATRPMREVVDATIASPRLAAFLSTGYALSALLVAIIGIHGAIAYLVHRRTREIGVRIALGAQSSQVLSLIIAQTIRLTGVGVVIGVAASIGATRLIGEQLYGVAPNDLLTLAGSGLAMVLVGCIASAIPAWRAARVSPLLALTDE